MVFPVCQPFSSVRITQTVTQRGQAVGERGERLGVGTHQAEAQARRRVTDDLFV